MLDSVELRWIHRHLVERTGHPAVSMLKNSQWEALHTGLDGHYLARVLSKKVDDARRVASLYAYMGPGAHRFLTDSELGGMIHRDWSRYLSHLEFFTTE